MDYAAKGYHCEATVAPDQVVAAAELLDKEGFSLDTITGVDWMAEGQMEVVYDYFHPAKALRVVVRTRIPRDNPEIPTIHKVFPGANWHERETHDFFGIRFLGHPNLTPFLLPEDADLPPAPEGFRRVISQRGHHLRRRAAARRSSSTWARSIPPPTACCASR